MEEDLYGKATLDKATDLVRALKYYITRTHELEIENQRLKEMYNNRVEEYIKITDRVGGKTIE